MSTKDGNHRRRREGRVPSLHDELPGDEGTATKSVVSEAPKSIRDRAFVLVLAGRSQGQMYLLETGEMIIGRSPQATIRISDDGVSRRHAKLTIERSEVRVADLKSANGTYVNGERLKASARLLADGDKISLGSTTILKFTFGDAVEETFQRRLLEAAMRDALTKAFNRNYLLERLQTEVAFAQRHGAPLALIMLDVDHFKAINDTYGHPAGDQVLIRVARVVQDTIRKEDVFARFGGEEFVVLCRGIDVEGARVLSERLRERIAAAVLECDGKRIQVTVSAGVAGLAATLSEEPKSIIARADRALYAAKERGRNRVVISDE